MNEIEYRAYLKGKYPNASQADYDATVSKKIKDGTIVTKVLTKEEDYTKRLKEAREKQGKSKLLPSPISIPYNPNSNLSSAIAKGKNITKGLLDIVGIPKRALADALTQQDMTDPNASLFKPLTEQIPSDYTVSVPSPIGTQFDMGGPTYDMRVKPVATLAGEIAGDPINYVGGLTSILGKTAGKSLLKSSLNIPKNIAKLTGESSIAAGRRKIVNDIVENNLEGNVKVWPFVGDKYETLGRRTQKALDKVKKIKEDKLTEPTIEQLRLIAKEGQPIDESKIFTVKVDQALQKLRNEVSAGAHPDVSPEDIDRMVKELDKIRDIYTNPSKTGIELESITGSLSQDKRAMPLAADQLRQKMERGLYKDASIFNHPLKTKAKELSGRSIAEAILEAEPTVARENKTISDLLTIKELAQEGADKGFNFKEITSLPATALSSMLVEPTLAPLLIKASKPIGRVVGGTLGAAYNLPKFREAYKRKLDNQFSTDTTKGK